MPYISINFFENMNLFSLLKSLPTSLYKREEHIDLSLYERGEALPDGLK